MEGVGDTLLTCLQTFQAKDIEWVMMFFVDFAKEFSELGVAGYIVMKRQDAKT